MSSIIREPLNGKEAICPVGPDFMHPYLSPRKCVENLILGTEVAAEDLGQNRCMMMPGRAWSIQQLVDAMTKIAGPEPQTDQMARGRRHPSDCEWLAL